MHETEVEVTASVYLLAADEDAGLALRAAIADLLDIRDEAELRKLALDVDLPRVRDGSVLRSALTSAATG